MGLTFQGSHITLKVQVFTRLDAADAGVADSVLAPERSPERVPISGSHLHRPAMVHLHIQIFSLEGIQN